LKRLICFGDSWTAGHGVETDVYWKEGEPSDFIVKLRQMNSWPRWLSDKLDCVFVNFGVCAWSNKQIAEQVETIVNHKYITKDDIVITMFSYPHRYRDTNILDSPEKIFEKLENLLTPYQHFYFNSFYPTFKDEGYDTKNLPDYFIKPDECVSDILKKYEIKNKIPQFKIYDQIKNGNIKIFSDITNKTSVSFILKISGIWETQMNYGLTYKFITIN